VAGNSGTRPGFLRIRGYIFYQATIFSIGVPKINQTIVFGRTNWSTKPSIRYGAGSSFALRVCRGSCALCLPPPVLPRQTRALCPHPYSTLQLPFSTDATPGVGNAQTTCSTRSLTSNSSTLPRATAPPSPHAWARIHAVTMAAPFVQLGFC
jgi:hypothetical protein